MPTPPTQRGFPLVLLALLSLATFAVAQSVYQAIAGNAEFVILNQITHADLWLIVLCFNVLPAVVLALLWQAVRVVAPAVNCLQQNARQLRRAVVFRSGAA